MRALENTGVSAIAVHTRYCTKSELSLTQVPVSYVHERPRDPAHWDEMTKIAQSSLNVPLIVNGDIYQRADIQRVRELTGSSGSENH